MRKFVKVFRLIHINFLLAKHGLDKIILSLHLLTPLRFLVYINPFNWFRGKNYNLAQAIRLCLEDLGPIFVKFGQALSTRQDLVPPDIAKELSRLQDCVQPFPGNIAVDIIEKQFAKPINEIFQSFNTTPLASASIAQVHEATLFDGKQVVVKILRPNIEKIIKRDLELMYSIAYLAKKYWSEGVRLRPDEIVEEFEKTITDELNFNREAANASQLRRNFLNSPLLYVPEIFWPYTRQKVMVMERIEGIPISNIDALKQQGIDTKILAERGVEIFFTQVFRDNYFHADMHPGNIFVANKTVPQYICVDFGIMGTLDNNDKRYLAENFLAFFKRDYRRVAELHVESGWVPYETRVTEFEAAIRTVCEPIFERPLCEISCAQMLMQLFETGRRFNMEIQPQLILLQKTLFAVEGLGRQLYPQLDLWSTAKPFLENWLREQISPKTLLKRVSENIPYWVEKMPDMPEIFHNALISHRQQQLEENSHRHWMKKQTHQNQKQQKKYLALGLGIAFFTAIGTPLLFQPATTALAVAGGISLLYAALAR